tara:strand:+ start:201 stop:470 length:270 start_codon:yes stop_codon:yes gene_type:complete
MIKTKQFSAASAVTAAILWIGCSALVVVLPEAMWEMTAQMLHVELAEMSWAMSWSGFISGLLSWSALAALTGFLLALIYNRLSKSDQRQ